MIEMSNNEIINKIKEHVEELVDDRNINGLCIFIQSSNNKESGLYVIGEISHLDLISSLNAFFNQKPSA